ncbi:MAG: rRNA pseudouridine synthase [Treponemataceae bacterium]|nr:rRNA pseudouridine synthase [Treponemataceae bacterium]
MKKERLDKILSHHGFGSRKDCKSLIHSGRVFVNGETCTDCEFPIDTEVDVIRIDDEVLQIREHVYIMMNKCQDVVSSTKDGLHKTVLDLLSSEYKINFLGGDLHPIGRLDIDTEGLLLLTTDGKLTHTLTSPKNHVVKTYYARLKNPVDIANQKEYSALFSSGLNVIAEGHEEAFVAKSATLVWPNENKCEYLTEFGDASSEVMISISEGKYHQVKRMFATVGNEVVFLKRISVGPLSLDAGLKPGEYRELTADEIRLLLG